MKVKKNKTKILSKKRIVQDDPARLSPEESLSFVWELTKEIYSLSGKYDVESRLQRDVVNIIRNYKSNK